VHGRLFCQTKLYPNQNQIYGFGYMTITIIFYKPVI
jgi:hypothetical protein